MAMNQPQLARVRGRCADCSGDIPTGGTFFWGRERGQRLCERCVTGTSTEPVNTPTSIIEIRQHALSPWQMACRDWVRNGTGSALWSARAGAGKTTMIEITCREDIPATLSVWYGCFNKQNADEAKRRLGNLPNVEVSTFHAAGRRALIKRLPKAQMNAEKVGYWIDELVMNGTTTAVELDVIGGTMRKLVNLARDYGMEAGIGLKDTADSWEELMNFFDLEFDIEGLIDEDARGADQSVDALRRHALDVTRKLFRLVINDRTQYDFADMLYMAVKFQAPLGKYDFIFVDEAQDTNPIQQAMIRMMTCDQTRFVAVGDEFQAIYGFRGALTEAMAQIAKDFNAITLPLPTNYRCSKAVIAEAQKICPDIEARPGADEGSVEAIDGPMWARDFGPTDVILCRLTAPLITLAYRLIAAGVPCKVRGRDIGKGLISLVQKMQGKRKRPLTINEFISHLAEWKDRETAKALAKGDESKVQSIIDRYESILAVIDALPEAERTLAGLILFIQDLFTDRDEGVPTLCTVHKSKGLEWPRVYILDPHLMPSKWARRDWSREQEKHLIYVAITRAQHELRYIDSDQIAVERPARVGLAASA